MSRPSQKAHSSTEMCLKSIIMIRKFWVADLDSELDWDTRAKGKRYTGLGMWIIIKVLVL